MNKLFRSALPLAALSLMVSATPAPTAGQDPEPFNDIACSCVYRSEATKRKVSDLVIVGRVSDKEYPDIKFKGITEDVAVILVDRVEKGRRGIKQVKLLGAWGYSGCCSASLSSVAGQYRFYLSRRDVPFGYYRLGSQDALDPIP